MHCLTGNEVPAEDVQLPSEWLSAKKSTAAMSLLYITDLACQFAKPLKLKPVPYQDLLCLLESADEPKAEAPEALWELYQSLLTVNLQACTLLKTYLTVLLALRDSDFLPPQGQLGAFHHV